MLLRALYFLAMIALPFSAVSGISLFGEMTRELSTYFFLPALGLCFFLVLSKSGRQYLDGSSTLSKLAAIILVCIIISFVANAYNILNDVFRDRLGIEKYTSSLLVVIFSIGVAFMTYVVTRERWQDVIITPIVISAMICVAFSVLEILGRKLHIASDLYTMVDNIVHAGFAAMHGTHEFSSKSWEQGWDQRLRSVAFEPPAFGNYSGFAWPWLYIAFVSNRGEKKIGYGIILALFTGLILLAEARTGYVMLAANLGVILLLKFIYLPAAPGKNYRTTASVVTALLALTVIGGIVSYLLLYDHLVAKVIALNSITNISRMSSIEAAFRMFMDSPFFGVGFGQFGFYIAEYMPHWGYSSYELLPKLTYATEPWPAVYSVYARFASELGLAGLIMWPVMWLWLAYQVITASLHLRARTGQRPIIAYGLVMCCIAVLTSGVATDTLRTQMIWVTLGLSCRYLYECRKATLTSFLERQHG